MNSRLDAYLQTIGEVPPAIAAMNRADPQVLDGFLTMHEAIMSDKDDGLPFKYKELIFVLLDLLAVNLDGARLHLGSALNAGLTRTELAEALFQTMLLHGLKTWGLDGHQLLAFAEAHPSQAADDAETSPSD